MQPVQSESHRWLVASSWSLAVVYCALSVLLGRAASSFSDIYRDMGARLYWPTASLLPVFHLPWPLLAALVVSVFLIIKDRRLAPLSATSCNVIAVLILICLIIFCGFILFRPNAFVFI